MSFRFLDEGCVSKGAMVQYYSASHAFTAIFVLRKMVYHTKLDPFGAVIERGGSHFGRLRTS